MIIRRFLFALLPPVKILNRRHQRILFFAAFVIFYLNFHRSRRLEGGVSREDAKARRVCFWGSFCSLLFILAEFFRSIGPHESLHLAMRQSEVMKAIPGSIGLGICALAALLAGCGFAQKPADSPPPQPAPPPPPRSFSQTVEVFQVAFDMVLVPGDEAKGIKTLYVGKHEVTWDEFLPWVYVGEYGKLGDKPEASALRNKRLCPTEIPYGDITSGFGCERYPAMHISRLHAEIYCEWLSAETGRAYRLPTNEEWEHIFHLGRGGAPDDLTPEEANRLAVYDETSWFEENWDLQTRRVGSKAPDLLGIHDMAGNVAEWVSGTGTNRVVRGGHFMSKLEELGLRGWLVEDSSWNETYPEVLPGSRCWCMDVLWTGFRLVCEP